MLRVLIAYWVAWNASNLGDVCRHLELAVTESVEWNDPRQGRTLMEGLDVGTVEPISGLIARVDGCFGHPTPILDGDSGVPNSLRPEQICEPAP